MMIVSILDIDSADKNVRHVTARNFSVIASGHGIIALLPFLEEVCKNKKTWQAR